MRMELENLMSFSQRSTGMVVNNYVDDLLFMTLLFVIALQTARQLIAGCTYFLS